MEMKLKELANDRLSGFHTICEDLKLGLLTCQEAKEYIQVLNEEFVRELEMLGVDFHTTHSCIPQETTAKVVTQVADLLAGNPCNHS